MIRLNLADHYAPPARTYLGWPIRRAVAVAVAAAAAGAALGFALPSPDPAPCGYVAEVTEGVATYLPASCMTDAELGAMLDAIRAERSGGRW